MYSFHLNNLPNTLNLDKGNYAIYITGGHFIKIDPDFKIIISEKDSTNPIGLKETLKVRTYRNKRKAVKLYSFEIISNSTFEIDINFPTKLVVKENMLAETPSLFRITNNLLFPEKYKKK